MEPPQFVNIFKEAQAQERQSDQPAVSLQNSNPVASGIPLTEAVGLVGSDTQPLSKPRKELRPEPLANPKLEKKICQLLRQLCHCKQIRKGVNEVMKQIMKGRCEVVILAADCDPLEIIMTLPPLCEEKNIPYCFISSKALLGRACEISRKTVAAAIVFREESQLTSQITDLKDKIEQLYI